jgi:hypothetical protein
LLEIHSPKQDSLLQSRRESAVDFRTKDPEHRAAGAGERSKVPLFEQR